MQLVAEELCVPFDRVKLIYCDTAFTPDQGITSGSQSHPANFNHSNLAQAAATAREALLHLASERLGVPARSAYGDRRRDQREERSLEESHLWRTGRRQEIQSHARPKAKRKPASEWTVLGTPAQRPDLPALVTGQFEFVHNVRVPGHAARPRGQAAGGGRHGDERG